MKSTFVMLVGQSDCKKGQGEDDGLEVHLRVFRKQLTMPQLFHRPLYIPDWCKVNGVKSSQFNDRCTCLNRVFRLKSRNQEIQVMSLHRRESPGYKEKRPPFH